MRAFAEINLLTTGELSINGFTWNGTDPPTEFSHIIPIGNVSWGTTEIRQAVIAFLVGELGLTANNIVLL